MGKVLRILVILLMLLGIGATVLAYLNYNKREVLIGRTHKLENMVVKIAGTLEAEDPAEVAQPSYPQRDISAVTSRELENPDRSTFWDTYNSKFEPSATTIPTIDLKKDDRDLQLREYFRRDSATGEYVIDQRTGLPATDGEGTMQEILDEVYDRAKNQYKVLLETRAELPKLREELIDTIDELNKLKQDARADKKTIEERDARIATLENEKRDLEARVERLNETIAEKEDEIAELSETVAKQEEDITQLADKVKDLELEIKNLRGADNMTIPTAVGPAQDGTLTPGVKGVIVSADDEWKYAIIKFSNEFMDELLGPARDRGLPQAEMMVSRPTEKDPEKAFVTRLRLRQAIRGDKNLVIADILSDWQQKPVLKGDIVSN